MRDFNKFLELMPSYTLFKLFQRPIMTIEGSRYLIPTIQDALDAKAAFNSIIETTKTGSDARVLEFYHKVVADKVNGSDAETLTDLYNKDKKHPKSARRIREWLDRLVEIGWVDVREGMDKDAKGYVDRRFNNYLPLKKNAANTAILETTVVLEDILEKSFNIWLENAAVETDPPHKIIILNIDGTATEITLEEMKTLILKRGGSEKTATFSKPKLNTESEKKAESTAIPEKTAIAVISNPKKTFNKYLQYDLNGNLYCETHFREQKKFCEENGTGLKHAETETSFESNLQDTSALADVARARRDLNPGTQDTIRKLQCRWFEGKWSSFGAQNLVVLSCFVYAWIFGGRGF